MPGIMPLLLTPKMRVKTRILQLPPPPPMEHCPRCYAKFSPADFELHDHTTCTPIKELIGSLVAENEPVRCPGGCGTIHPHDIALHRKLGCQGAADIGYGPFATGNEVSLAD